MQSYISRRAVIEKNVYVAANVVILGPTRIKQGTIVLHGVTLGFPERSKLLDLRSHISLRRDVLELLDEVSSGCEIGKGCILRSGCVIYENVQLGDECELGHNVLIRENTVIGERTRIGTGTVIEGDVRIGSNVNIQSNVYIPRGTIIEDDVFIGPCVVITNDKYPPSKRLAPVVIRRGAVLGAGCVILPGVEIGEQAVVAAGSVVTRDVPPRTVVMGVPARPAYSYEEYLAKRRRYEEVQTS